MCSTCIFYDCYVGNRILRTDFVALESSPGQFLRLTSSSTPEKFQLALRGRNSREVSGLLMSMVVGNKGVEGTPTALLANQIKEELFVLHGETSADNVPGRFILRVICICNGES